MVDFIKTQESEVKALTTKIENHFNTHGNASKNKHRYQKLLENRMISSEYQLKDSCNIFSKKQLNEQFFVTSPNIQSNEMLKLNQTIEERQQQQVNQEQKKVSGDHISERYQTLPSKLDEDAAATATLFIQRRSTNYSLTKDRSEKITEGDDKQPDQTHLEEEFQIQNEHIRRQSMTKNNFLLKAQNSTSKLQNSSKMPTFTDYQKFKLANLDGMQTFHTNLYSTFYETPKLSDATSSSLFQVKQQQLNQNKPKSQQFDQLLTAHTSTKKRSGENVHHHHHNNNYHSRQASLADSQSNNDKQSSYYNTTTDFYSSKLGKFNNNNNNLKSTKRNIQINTINSNKNNNNNDIINKDNNINGVEDQSQQETNENVKNLQMQYMIKNKIKPLQQKMLDKFDKFKFIKKIDLEMGVNFTFKQHLERLKEDPTFLEHFQAHLNQQNPLGQGGHTNTMNNQQNNNNNNNNNGMDSKANLSVSRYGNSQLQSKAQFNSRANVSKTNALSSSQLSVKNERKYSKVKKQEEQQGYYQDLHMSSQTSTNHLFKQNNSAVIEIPSNLFMRNNNNKRFSILPLQQSQSVVQNFNFPLQFLTSLSREESTKINTVQAFFPDFQNNLRCLEKSKQTKKRAARTLKKILGWSEKMSALILNEEGTEIKKDLDFQTAFFEEIFRAQKQNQLKEINQNKKENSNQRQTQVNNLGFMTLSFDVIWENFQKYQYLNKNLIVLLEKKEKEQYKANRGSLLEEIIDIHKMHSQQLNKFPLTNKQYQFILSLPNNIQHILDRKNYLQKEQALDNLEFHELNLGKFPFLLSFERIRSKYISLSNEIIRNYEKYV